MEMLSPLEQAVNRPRDYVRRWKENNGGRVVGYLCSYAPVEIIAAGGHLPFRIFSSGRQTFRADAHLQSYCCQLIRGVLDDGLSGRLDFLDGVVFGHTCDSMQRLSDIWRLNVARGFHADVVLPVTLDGIRPRRYLAEILASFRRALDGKTLACTSDDGIRETAGRYNRLRQYIRQVYAFRSESPPRVSSRELGTIVRASMVMDVGEMLAAMPGILRSLEARTPSRRTHARRLVLSGGVCDIPDLHQVIENAGGAVVWDDLCSGYRWFEGDIAPDRDIMAAIAERYADRTCCPAKHAERFDRGDALARMAAAHGADGVILVLLKFCDPHAFDIPHIRAVLEGAGIPSLLLEIEDPRRCHEQVRTRCEAFLETI